VTTRNFKQVFSVFKQTYRNVPLEIFGKDTYKTLISTVLSSRTKDETTLEASKRLFKYAPDFNRLSKLKTKEISKLIYPVGFYKTKAKHLKNLSITILNKFKGQVPKTREGLMSLPGVGRKTANLVLNRAFEIPAIAVDTHVHKISNILGWVKTRSPDETEKELIKILPKKYWPDTNRLFVSIGQQYRSKARLKEFLKKKRLLITSKSASKP
jgi:endonuclease III